MEDLLGIEKAWQSFCDFEKCSRFNENQSVSDFIEVWQQRLNEVQSYGLQYTDYVLALKLVYSCQLTQQLQKSVLYSLYSNNKDPDRDSMLLQTMVSMLKMTNDPESVKCEQDFEFDNEPIPGSPDYIDDHLDPPILKNDLDLLNSKLINDHNHVDNDDLKTEKFDEKMDLSTREDVKGEDTGGGGGEESKAVIKADCDACGLIGMNLSVYKSHINTCTQFQEKSQLDEAFTCGVCNKLYPSLAKLKEHIKNAHTRKNFVCTKCNKTFKEQHVLEKHMTRKHDVQIDADWKPVKLESIKRPKKKDVEITVLATCTECGTLESSVQAYKAHVLDCQLLKQKLEIEGEKNFSCGICNKKVATYNRLKWHIRDSHLKRLSCHLCPKKFKKRQALETHLAVHERKAKSATDNKIHQCEQCGKEFAKLWKLSRHRLTHSEFKCLSCSDAYFETQEDLDVHIQNHKDLICATCQKSFTCKIRLARHKPCGKTESIACDECGKLFGNRENLRCHKKIHKEPEFKCPKEGCGKAFVMKYVLKKHILRHEGLEKYPCQVCDKVFVKKIYLKNHMDRHMNNRRFPCDECGKKFYNKETLATHIRTHTGEKPFQCDECDRAFNRSWYLNKHKRTAHTFKMEELH